MDIEATVVENFGDVRNTAQVDKLVVVTAVSRSDYIIEFAYNVRVLNCHGRAKAESFKMAKKPTLKGHPMKLLRTAHTCSVWPQGVAKGVAEGFAFCGPICLFLSRHT